MRTPSTFIAWGMCAVALCLWTSVVLFVGMIDAQHDSAVAAMKQQQQAGVRRAAGSAAIALAAATVSGRAQLLTIVDRDVLSLTGLITAAGQDAGVALTITDVTPGTAPVLSGQAALNPLPVSFAVKASDTFPKLLSAAAFLEALPAASAIDELQLSRSDTAGAWDMDVQLDMLTDTTSP